MKVLMVWDQGINYLLVKWLKPHGVTVAGITRRDFDPYGYTPDEWKIDYRGRFYPQRLMLHILTRARGCDLIHVHSLDRVVPPLKMLGFKVVLHYHGSDIRGRWADRRRYWGKADAVIVSTRDLLIDAPDEAQYQPNPIDTELFHPSTKKPRWGALHFDYDSADLAELIARINNIPLTIHKKNVPYRKMPEVLQGYTHYIDVKRDRGGKVLSSRATDTGSLISLQSLACGCTVFTLLRTRVGLPPEHQPEAVAQRIFKVYEEALR